MKRELLIGGVTFDLQLMLMVVLSTILPMLDYYNHHVIRANLVTGVKAYDRFVYYFIIPLLVILFVWSESPRDYGLQWGNWRLGLKWVMVAALVMGVILWFVARTPSMSGYYVGRTQKSPIMVLYLNALDLWGWEFIWRGFFLFGLAQKLGAGPAIMIQAIPFAFMHLGKPEIETLSTIFGGMAFGLIAWQTQSMVYPFVIHWFIASFTMLLAVRGGG